MIDSRAIIGLLRSATRRSILLALVALSIAVNAASGAFAGVVHAHDHEHGQQHAHDHDDHLHHDNHGGHDDHDDSLTLAAPGSTDGNGSRGYHDTLHEHGATVVLALVQIGSHVPIDVVSSPGLRFDRGPISDVKHQLERPPRRA